MTHKYPVLWYSMTFGVRAAGTVISRWRRGGGNHVRSDSVDHYVPIDGATVPLSTR
jgi:hypothetical protein